MTRPHAWTALREALAVEHEIRCSSYEGRRPTLLAEDYTDVDAALNVVFRSRSARPAAPCPVRVEASRNVHGLAFDEDALVNAVAHPVSEIDPVLVVRLSVDRYVRGAHLRSVVSGDIAQIEYALRAADDESPEESCNVASVIVIVAHRPGPEGA